jgi:hypothetical protein
VREGGAEPAFLCSGWFGVIRRNDTSAADGSVMSAACHLGGCAAIGADEKWLVHSLQSLAIQRKKKCAASVTSDGLIHP